MNKWLIVCSKLSNGQLSQLVEFFALQVPAVQVVYVLQINRRRADQVHQVIRQHIARWREQISPLREGD